MAQGVPEARLHERSSGVHSIDRLLGGLLEGRGGSLFLTGDAGLGKTTLLTWPLPVPSRIEVARGRGQAMEVELLFGLATRR